MLDEATMRARFHESVAEAKAIRAKSGLLRERRDALAQQIAPIEAEMKALAKQIHAIEQPALPALCNEAAALARALNGKTGESPTKE